MRPAIRTFPVPPRCPSSLTAFFHKNYELHTAAPTRQLAVQPALGVRRERNSSEPRRYQQTIEPSSTIVDTEQMLRRVLSPPSTSSSTPKLDAATLQIFFLSWQASPAFKDADSSKRLAIHLQSVYDLPSRWTLGVMKRLQLGHRVTQPDVLSAEVDLLTAIHDLQITSVHQSLQRLFDLYTANPDTRHIAFGLLEVLTHYAEAFIRHIDLDQRIEVSALLKDSLRRPQAPVPRHQLWTFLLSDACAILLARPTQDYNFTAQNLTRLQDELGRDRADELAKSQLFYAFSEITLAQHLHWIQNARSRPKFRATAVEAFFGLKRHQETAGKKQLKLVNLVADTALGLLPSKANARALRLMQLWDGHRTQLYWSALVKVAAAADQDATLQKHTVADSHDTPQPAPSAPSHLLGALQDLPAADITPSLFVALLMTARHDIAWLSSLSKMAQQSSLASHRKVQDSVVEAVLSCFEHHRKDLHLTTDSDAALQAHHRSTRVFALQGRVQQAISRAMQAALSATGVRTGQEAKRREVRLTSILIRAVSAALAHGRTDLALDVMLSEHIPSRLLHHQLVQRVASASAAQHKWSGSSGLGRVCDLFDKCQQDVLAQVLHRPKLVFEMIQSVLDTTHSAAHSKDGTPPPTAPKVALERSQRLVSSFRGTIESEDIVKWIRRARTDESIRVHVLRHLDQTSSMVSRS